MSSATDHGEAIRTLWMEWTKLIAAADRHSANIDRLQDSLEDEYTKAAENQRKIQRYEDAMRDLGWRKEEHESQRE